MSSLAKFHIAERYRGNEKSIWVDFDVFKEKYKPIDLGGGFPQTIPKNMVMESLREVCNDNNWRIHQYSKSYGLPRLMKAVSELYSPIIGRSIDPDKEVVITYGAQEALHCAIFAQVNPGDEVILIEPFFDAYKPIIESAGGVIKSIPLQPRKHSDVLSSADFIIDFKQLASLFNPATKMIIVNTPQNPLGKVYNEEECTVIATLCKKWNVICVCDEVYEWLIYNPCKMVRIASLLGMWEQTISIGSGGKTLHATGWKTGWAYGPANLIQNMRVVHQHTVYACVTPIQEAMAICLEKEISQFGKPRSLFSTIIDDLQPKRDYFAKSLLKIGMNPVIPDGGYFMLVNFSDFAKDIKMCSEDGEYLDQKFSKWMIKNLRILGIPPSTFFSDKHKQFGENYIRFSFIRDQSVLEEVIGIFTKWKMSLN